MLHSSHPTVPIYACGSDLKHAAELEAAGALATVVTSVQAGMSLGCRMLASELGMTANDVAFLTEGVDEAIAAR